MDIADALAIITEWQEFRSPDFDALRAARNIGIRASSGDVLMFIDADCIAAPDWLVRLAERHDDPKTSVTNKFGQVHQIDNLFVELQDHGLAAQRDTNPRLVELARRINAPIMRWRKAISRVMSS
mgnify:CR=1 FL=1